MLTKKNLFAFAAIAMAAIVIVTISAFKIESSANQETFQTLKMEDPVTMYYHGESYDKEEVEKISNWNTTPSDCEEGSDLACQVTVSEDLVSGSSFISTVSLVAEAGTASALLQVLNNNSPQFADIVNRD